MIAPTTAPPSALAPAGDPAAPSSAGRRRLFEVEHLSMRFGGLVAIDDISFAAAEREITAIIGPNGAGKTTVFNCLTGFYQPTAGLLALHHPAPGERRGGAAATQTVPAPEAPGGDWRAMIGTLSRRHPMAPLHLIRRPDGGNTYLLERMHAFEIGRRARVARTFQNIRLFAGMSVLENLLVAQHHRLMRASGYSVFGLLGLAGYRRAERAAIEHARYWLDRVGLVAVADHPAGGLPYGAQRRLEIARAMCSDPVLLCLDEPAAGLNPRESAELSELLLFIRDSHLLAILLIEHDMSVVMQISDHIVVLDYGRQIAEGPPEQVRRNPAVIRAYLGEEEEVDSRPPDAGVRKEPTGGVSHA